MKKVISLALLCMTLVSTAQAQMRHIREAMERRREMNPPSALKIMGVSCVVVGSVGGVLCGYIYLMSGYHVGWQGPVKKDYTFLEAAGVGGAMLVGGIVMLVIDRNHSGRGRFSFVSPQANSLGIAYNFR